MWYSLFARLGGFLLIAAIWYAVLSAGSGCASHSTKEQSWDQENLKRNDHGCPTAIYIAPGGVLTQCD